MALISKDPDDYVGPGRIALQSSPDGASVRPGTVMVRLRTDTLVLAVATTMGALALWAVTFLASAPNGEEDNFSPVALVVLGAYFLGLTMWTQAPRRKQVVEPWPADVGERPDRRVALRTGGAMATVVAAIAAYALAGSDERLWNFMAAIMTGQAIGMWLALRTLKLLEDRTGVSLYRSSGGLWRNAESKRRFAKPSDAGSMPTSASPESP